MARKPKIEPIASRNFVVMLTAGKLVIDRSDLVTVCVAGQKHWLVRNIETLAETAPSNDFDQYYKLKRVWRKSKEDFDSACRFMDYKDLFSTAGVKL